jgi:hypothetical protein
MSQGIITVKENDGQLKQPPRHFQNCKVDNQKQMPFPLSGMAFELS